MGIEQLALQPVTGRIAPEINTAVSTEKPEKPFTQFLSEALSEVNNLQQQSRQASLNLALGKIQDISEVTIAAEKASVALQLTMQVRSKIIDAYQEVMRMQV
ncbi:MAG TPA: flagellar hook-basal body complex protein FliE [Methylomusa anaerophila]|uniref:Flagellar hook-basal body complex protein FliE n=1 Tax=Methylomusa anaerophila TaxID=1930071 RepID=A0A348AQ42_9FIRM|nr:flagellar hook-basal body complex protein FliE [Methylomusa anaerophila]BBB93190.1 flagellar hook-basal body complex protein FliE [Methylomusa anaerophila]HML86978.1 flagellar hook-basal body complex protein FliE [Methylomusa anaerophila]